MNYYGPRQRESDGRFDYTVANRRSGTRAIGYCTEFRLVGAESLPEEIIAQANARIEKHKAKYHTDGHATADEACACYKEYLLDCWEDEFAHRGADRWKGAQHQCRECKEWTQEFVQVNHLPIDLCPTCQRREVVAKHVSVGTSMSSY